MPETPTGSRSKYYYRAKVASLSRSRLAADPELVDARQQLTALRLAEQINKAVAAEPPLTTDQRTELAALLAGGAR